MQVGTWIGGFGMERMPDEHLQHVRASLRMLLFPGTTILSHRLPAAPIPIDPPPSLWTVWPPFLSSTHTHARSTPPPLHPTRTHSHMYCCTYETCRGFCLPLPAFLCHQECLFFWCDHSQTICCRLYPLSDSCSVLSTTVRYRLHLPTGLLHDR